jgi:hypothetical protein
LLKQLGMTIYITSLKNGIISFLYTIKISIDKCFYISRAYTSQCNMRIEF